MAEKNRNEHVSDVLEKMHIDSEHSVKLSATVNRACVDKISTEMINQKVSSQMNAITAGIHNINPKFKEGSKNYDTIKSQIVTSLANYETALMQLSDFYDGKTEQLILRKVELEAQLVGVLFKKEHLHRKKIKKINQKENDQVHHSIRGRIKSMIDTLKSRDKESKEPDVNLMKKMQDGKDIEVEVVKNLENRIEKTKVDQKDNELIFDKVRKEIRLIDDEIERINERKTMALKEAMEVGGKGMVATIKKPKMFKSITRFFANRFNTQKMVVKTIIEPLNQRIEDFNNNELSNIK